LHYTIQKINNGITALLLHWTAMLMTGRCHITLSPWKIRSLRCGLSSKFSDHLFNIYVANFVQLPQTFVLSDKWYVLDVRQRRMLHTKCSISTV